MAALLVGLSMAAACGTQGSTSWAVSFGCEAARQDVVSVRTRLRAGGCTGPVVYEATFDRRSMGGGASAPTPVGPGIHGFEAASLNQRGETLSVVCIESLAGPDRSVALIFESGCDLKAPPDAGPAEAPDAGEQMPPADAGEPMPPEEDDCPADESKSAPGTCGCGTPDDDSDGDGLLDCEDACPADGSKAAPGTCGCGTPDDDSDGDGLLDCEDACPADGSKAAPGTCGCGTPDDDSDRDGTPDCQDSCPGDEAKVSPGECGCGVTEDACRLQVDDALGAFRRLPIENGYHSGNIERTANGLRWINADGVSWVLVPDLDNRRLETRPDCPYYGSPDGNAFRLAGEGRNITGFLFLNELYSRAP